MEPAPPILVDSCVCVCVCVCEREREREREREIRVILVAWTVKSLLTVWETEARSWGRISWRSYPLGYSHQGMATHCSILAWRIPWTEEPGGLQSMGSQIVWHDCAIRALGFI